MIKKLIPFLTLLFFVNVSFAQMPELTFVKKSTAVNRMTCTAGMDAGEVQEGTFTGISNDVDFPQVFLQFSDEINIDHINGTADLSGDPDLATTAGIGYALYQCPPTISGDELTDILSDPCLQQPLPTAGNPFWLTFGDIGGNATFENDGAIQNLFAGGDPIEIYFAPITVDDFANRIYEVNGPCVNARIDQAFSVVFLNEMAISNEVLSGTTGSFMIEGGLSEFDGMNYASITIVNAANPAIVGTVTSGGAGHGDVVNFTVPEEGTYIITVVDDKNGSVSTQLVSTSCAGLELQFQQITIAPNGVGCVPMVANGFTDIVSVQFTMNYDPTVLTFNSIANLNLGLTGVTVNNFGTPPTPIIPEGTITFLWLFVPSGSSLPDGDILFELCFDAVGTVGATTTIGINPSASAPNPMMEASNASMVIVPICQTPEVVTIANLLLTGTEKPASCYEGTDGELDISVSGGNAPYTYTYENILDATEMGSGTIATDGGMDNIPGLTGEQVYQIVISDSSNPTPETTMSNFTIPNPPEIGGQTTSLNPTCAGDSDGSVQLNISYDGFTVTLPDPDFSVLWNTGATTQDITMLPAGNYDVVITHIPTGCTNNNPVATILANPAPINTGLTSQIATCAGFLDGSVTAMPTGGMGPYNFSWDSPIPNPNLPSTNATVNNLDPGRYYITIEDSSGSGCIVIDSIDVGATTIIEANAIIQDVSCFGAADGSINLSPSAIGTNNGGYSFDWNDLPAPMNPEDRDLLDGGQYEVTIEDSAGCMFTDTYEVLEPDEIVITLDDLMNETCVGGDDGSATISVTGGDGTYTYDWGTTPNQTTAMASNLEGGTYVVTVTDGSANMCTDTLSVVILPPDPPLISVPDTTILECSNSVDGTLTVDILSTTSPVDSYSWSPNTADNTMTVTDLGIGTYFVTVTTEDGCSAVDTAVITSPNPITLVDTLFQLPVCPEFNNGNVNIMVEGGTPPYTYTWSTGFLGQNPLLPQLFGDSTYCATITDSNGCESLEVCMYLPIPPPIVATFTDTTSVSCNNGITCDASASPVVSGGTGGNDYNFQWATNEVDSIANALCAGWNVVAIDDGICSIIDSVFINAPAPISVDVNSIIIDEPSCFGLSDGGATLNATGGTPPFAYEWDTGSLTNSISGVPEGSYDVSITDNNGCPFSFVVPIDQPDSLVATIDPFGTNNALCFGDDGGRISVIWTGGNQGPETYMWTNNISNGAIASDLPVGTYGITVTDVNGCSDTTQHTINQPAPIVAVIPPPMEPACFGFQTFITIDTVFGGNPGLFTYSVDNGPQQLVNAAIPVFADMPHLISVFDSEGCQLDTTIFINQPNEVIVNLGPDIEIQLGDSIQLEPLPVSAIPIDSIGWTPGTYLSCTNCYNPWAAPLTTTEYTFTIQDQNGCVGSDDIIIDVDKNRNIYIPNIFSPNGDGFNDIFKVESGPGVVDVNFMYIFDRWGELLFERQNFQPSDHDADGWDGNFKGKRAPTGVYVYLIEVDFADGITLLYRGDVTIIR